jgi:hypothetical protein
MLENTIEKNYFLPLIVVFFLVAITHNIAYFHTFGGSLSFFLYIPMSFTDLVKTGLVASLYLIIYIIIFQNIFIDPVINKKFPSIIFLLVLSVLVFIINIVYFLVLEDKSDNIYNLIAELLFVTFTLTAFFGIIYFFLQEKSNNFLIITFIFSLIAVSWFTGFVDARIDIWKAPREGKSKILLVGDKIISAKVLRSFSKGILVMISKNSDINFISWDQIKEAKFKRVNKY